jgi:peptide/nickel transport system substrate-binding protein
MAERVIGGVAHEDIAEKAQADLAEVGIKANLKPTERTVILADHRAGEVGFLVWMTSLSYYDIHAFTVFLPGAGYQADRAQWTEERADQEILDLRDAVMNEMDPDKRLELWDQIQEYWQMKSARIPVVQPQHAYAVRNDIEGFVFNLGWRVDPYILSRKE